MGERVGEMDGRKKRAGETKGKEASKRINVSIDPDILDCSICSTPLRPPLFQCCNGHVVCSSCGAKPPDKCHMCLLPTTYSRCRSLEAIVEAMMIPCPNSTFGCRQIIPYVQKEDTHEESCPFAPCSCPYSSCTFEGPTTLLSEHIQMEHCSDTRFLDDDYSFKVALQQKEPFCVLLGKDHDIFLVLNATNVPYGSSLSIACIRPGSINWDFKYEIVVKGKRSELRLRASPKYIRQWKVGSPPAESFLFVPHGFGDSDGVIFINVLIEKLYVGWC